MDAQRRRLTVGTTAGPGVAVPKAGKGTNDLHTQIAALFPKATCIHSVTDSELKKTRSYAEKSRAAVNEARGAVDAAEMAKKPCPVTIPGVAFTCKKGLKPESPNQDSFVAISLPEKWSLYGVFDGHGPFGHDVSDFAVKTLVMKFFDIENFDTDPGAALTTAFLYCQDTIEANKSILDSSSSGSTCTMAFHNIETDELTVAYAGDSRSVLYSGSIPGEIHHATEDHKPNLPAEQARIEKMGGRVVFDGYYNHRVFAKAGMYPGLNMSRALGDVVAHKEAGLTAEPEVITKKLKPLRGDSALTLLICSDGVWEFLKNETAMLSFGGKGQPVDPAKLLEGAEKLAKNSWDAWMEDSDNEISDDITVVAVML